MKIANIPYFGEENIRIVGFKITPCDEAWGEFGMSEPTFWFENYIKAGIKNHDGQKLLVKHILDTDKGISETTRTILEMLVGENNETN